MDHVQLNYFLQSITVFFLPTISLVWLFSLGDFKRLVPRAWLHLSTVFGGMFRLAGSYDQPLHPLIPNYPGQLFLPVALFECGAWPGRHTGLVPCFWPGLLTSHLRADSPPLLPSSTTALSRPATKISSVFLFAESVTCSSHIGPAVRILPLAFSALVGWWRHGAPLVGPGSPSPAHKSRTLSSAALAGNKVFLSSAHSQPGPWRRLQQLVSTNQSETDEK